MTVAKTSTEAQCRATTAFHLLEAKEGVELCTL